MKPLFLTGTGTGVGKTHAAAALLLRYPELLYWKPIQTGSDEDDDRATVERLTGLSAERFLPTGHSFQAPLSPHRAAELEGCTLSVADLVAQIAQFQTDGPARSNTVLIEGAGGLFVPLNRKGELWSDLIVQAALPTIVVASTQLGTINHSLLTVAALRSIQATIVGLLFCGARNEDNVRTVVELTGVPLLGAFDLHEGALVDHACSLDPQGRVASFL